MGCDFRIPSDITFDRLFCRQIVVLRARRRLIPSHPTLPPRWINAQIQRTETDKTVSHVLFESSSWKQLLIRNSIESFLNRIAKPTVNEVADVSNRELLASDDIVIIAQVAANNDETLFEERFRETAERYVDRFTFVLSAAGAGEAKSLQCYNNIDSSSFRTTELASHGAIEAFVKRCSAPLIPELTRRNELTYLSVSLTRSVSRRRTDKNRLENHSCTISPRPSRTGRAGRTPLGTWRAATPST